MAKTKSKKTTTVRNNTVLTGAALVVILGSALAAAVVLNNNNDNTDTSDLSSSIEIDNGDLKIDWSRYGTYDINLDETGATTISQAGTYNITGTLTDGAITIKAINMDVRLILNGVTIKNSSGPAIYCIEADELVVELAGENTLEDGSSYSDNYSDEITGVIYSECDLTLQGDGTLNIVSNYQDGIVGKDDLKINSGTYNITSVDDGIRGTNSVYIVDGTFNIETKADAIKSTNEKEANKGFVLIENGNFNISAGTKGIEAVRNILIYNGTINITKSYEGLEAQSIMINGGKLSITANDDGMNAGSKVKSSSSTNTRQGVGMDADYDCAIIFNGGDVYVNAAGDGLDSNGYIYINGGNIVVDGPTNNGNGALDSGAGISQSGGTIIAIGASGMAETPGSNSSAHNVSIYFSSTLAAGTKVEIKNASDNTIISHTSAKTFNHMVAGTNDFEVGQTYTIYVDGTKYSDFTVIDTTTTVGNSNQNYQNIPGRR